MPDLKLVTYCGLYCGLCSQKNRIPQKAKDLHNIMKLEGYEYWGGELPGFKEFWKFLRGLIKLQNRYACRDGKCGAPFCGIRKCAIKKGIDICVFCKEYPCKKIGAIAKGYPTLLADGQRLKEIGIDKWLKEQKDRAKTGFCYCDIRRYPYEVPRE